MSVRGIVEAVIAFFLLIAVNIQANAQEQPIGLGLNSLLIVLLYIASQLGSVARNTDLMRQHLVGHSEEPPSAIHADSGDAWFVIRGTDQKTGKARTTRVQAATENQAREAASAAGILVSEVRQFV